MLEFLRDYILFIWNVIFSKFRSSSESITSSGENTSLPTSINDKPSSASIEDKEEPSPPSSELQTSEDSDSTNKLSTNEGKSGSVPPEQQVVPSESNPIQDIQTPKETENPDKSPTAVPNVIDQSTPINEVRPASKSESVIEKNLPTEPEPKQPTPTLPKRESKKQPEPINPPVAALSEPHPINQPKPANITTKDFEEKILPPKPVNLSYASPSKEKESSTNLTQKLETQENFLVEDEDIETNIGSEENSQELDEKIKSYLKEVRRQEKDNLLRQPSDENVPPAFPTTLNGIKPAIEDPEELLYENKDIEFSDDEDRDQRI